MVALKFLHAADEQHMVRRFMQEARAQSRRSPRSRQGPRGRRGRGLVYIAMQYVDGQALHQASPTLSINDKARLIKEAAEALHAAHQLEIIHRDVKPANIMLQRGRMGWRTPWSWTSTGARGRRQSGLTESGAMMGNACLHGPGAGARRQAGRWIAERMLWPGATLYALRRATAFGRDASRHHGARPERRTDVVAQHQPALPSALRPSSGKRLNKEPAQRYPSALVLAEAIWSVFCGNSRSSDAAPVCGIGCAGEPARTRSRPRPWQPWF